MQSKHSQDLIEVEGDEFVDTLVMHLGDANTDGITAIPAGSTANSKNEESDNMFPTYKTNKKRGAEM